MAKCCIKGCNTNSRQNFKGLSFFKFPKNENVNATWIENIGVENIKPTAVRRICSKHFEPNCVNRTLGVVRLKDDVIPTLFPFISSSDHTKAALTVKTEFNSKLPEPLDTLNPTSIPGEKIIVHAITSRETQDKMKKLNFQVQKQRKKIKVLNQKCRRLKQKVQTFQRIIDKLKLKNLALCKGAIVQEEFASSLKFLCRRI